MPTEQSYLVFVLDQLAPLSGVSYRAMMGEYILYYRGKIFGGIYDDRLLVKQTAAAKKLLPDAPSEIPYPGAKPMLLVEEIDDRDFLCDLVKIIAEELPEPKIK